MANAMANALCIFERTDTADITHQIGGGPVATVWLSHSRGPVCTGGRQVTKPGLRQSQLPRNCLRPPECNRITRRTAPAAFTPKPADDRKQGPFAIKLGGMCYLLDPIGTSGILGA